MRPEGERASMVSTAGLTAGRALPAAREPRPPRAFFTGLIPNSGVERDGEGMCMDGKGLHPKMLLGHKGCFGLG